MPDNQTTPKKWSRCPLLVAFLAFLWGFSLLDMLAPAREYSEMENRYLAEAPAPSARSLLNNSYTLRYEEYVNDQFLLRDGWITVKSLSESALGKRENNGVLYGADGYLFEKLTAFEDAQLWKNVGFVGEFAELYPQCDITFSIIPNSAEILSDKLPDGYAGVDQAAVIDAVYAQLADSGARTLDLAPALRAQAAAGEQVYYRTDHHWTTRGAWAAYADLMAASGREAVSLDSLTAHEVTGFLGTHYSKAKLWNAQPDTIVWYDIPAGEVLVDGEPVGGLYDLDRFETRDKYAAFLHSNNALTVFGAGAPEGEEPSRVLLIKDSYGNSLAPFLALSYDEVYVVDLRFVTGIRELMEGVAFDEIYIMYNFSTLIQDLHLFKLTTME